MSVGVSTLLLSSPSSDDQAPCPSTVAKSSSWTGLSSLILALAFFPFKWFRKGRLKINVHSETKSAKQEEIYVPLDLETSKKHEDINHEKKLDEQKLKKCHLPVSVRSRTKRPDSPTRPSSPKETSSEIQQTEPRETKSSCALCSPETKEIQAQAVLPGLKSYLPKAVKPSSVENKNSPSAASSFVDSSLQTEKTQCQRVLIQTENVECENVEVMAVVPLVNVEIDASINPSFQNQSSQCETRRKRSRIAVAPRSKKRSEGSS